MEQLARFKQISIERNGNFRVGKCFPRMALEKQPMPPRQRTTYALYALIYIYISAFEEQKSGEIICKPYLATVVPSILRRTAHLAAPTDQAGEGADDGVYAWHYSPTRDIFAPIEKVKPSTCEYTQMQTFGKHLSSTNR